MALGSVQPVAGISSYFRILIYVVAASGVSISFFLLTTAGMLLMVLGQGIIIPDPILHLDDGIFRGAGADNDPFRTGIYDHSAAHGAGGGIAEDLSGGGVLS